MNKTKIEWCDFSINPVKGYCPMACPYCYARKMYDRFGWDKTIRFEPKVLDEIGKIKKPSRIFVGSTIELFREWVKDEWIEEILATAYCFPQHTFIFLSKEPERYASFGFPENCLLGATVTCQKDLWRVDTMRNIGGFISCEPLLEDISKFVSFEPLLGGMHFCDVEFDLSGVDWVIIGAQTKPYRPPKREWVEKLLITCKARSIPLFLKDNLIPVMGEETVRKHREFPK